MHNENWTTPDDLFQVLDEGGEYMGIHFDGFHFDIDLAATAENSKCVTYGKDYLYDIYSQKNTTTVIPNYLKNFAENLTCFMNPPYSRKLIKPFIQKAWSDSRWCKIVCLVKVDPSTEWWATFWDYNVNRYVKESIGSKLVRHYNGPKPGCEVIYFPKRIKFDPPAKLDLRCNICNSRGKLPVSPPNDYGAIMSMYPSSEVCYECKGTGKRKLSGPSFPSCLLIFNRRGL